MAEKAFQAWALNLEVDTTREEEAKEITIKQRKN